MSKRVVTLGRDTLGSFVNVAHGHPVRLKLTLSLGEYLVGSWCNPMGLALMNQFIRRGLGNMNFPNGPIAFHAGSRIHGIAKELKARLLTMKDTGCRVCVAVDEQGAGKILCVRRD
jgi:hypothetical protein